MITVMEACESIRKEFGQVAIETLVETEMGWLVSIADSKGNPYTMPMVLVSNQDGACMDAPEFFDEFKFLDIPEQFLSEKGRLQNYLLEEIRSETALSDVEMCMAMNIVFDPFVTNSNRSDTYAIVKYFLRLVELFCSDEERSDGDKLLQNEMARGFLDSSLEDKKQRSYECRFVPSCVKEYEDKTLDVLQMALDKKVGKEIQQTILAERLSQLKELEAKLPEQLRHEESPYYDETFIAEKIKLLQESVALEIAYCLGETDEFSRRIQAAEAQEVASFSESFDIDGFPSFEELLKEEDIDHEL